jgi:digeranylgeranylglycerophospholipid reductase
LDEYDVVIIGAGPAGAAAGYFLRRLDPRTSVLTVDRLGGTRYARYHRMCGEAVSEAAFRDLAPLAPKAVVHKVSKVREVWPGGTVLETRSDGFILDRPKFLQGMLSDYSSMGGVTTEDAVEGIAQDDNGVTVRLTSGRSIKAGKVIGADGAHSVVRRTLFKEEPPVMLWTEQHLVKKQVDSDTMTFIQAEKYKGGYRWEFPAGELARIGFPRGTDAVSEEIVETHRRAIPAGGLSRVVLGNALLAGDAAAMANPLTSGGIRVAMLSGRRAAEAIVAGDIGRYQGWWSSSPFAQDKYLKAFMKFQGMTDQDYVRAARGFGGPVKAASLIWAYLVRPEYRDIYRAYGPSGKYGW